MKDDEKIFDAFRSAANSKANPDFPGMENIWTRVEDKIDREALRTGISRWKKLAIAASILLVGTIAFLLIDTKPEKIEDRVVIAAPELIEAPVAVVPAPVTDTATTIIFVEPKKQEVATAVQSVEKAPVPEPELPLVALDDAVATTEHVQNVQADQNAEAEIVAGIDPGSQVELMVAEPIAIKQAKSAPLLVVDGKAVTGKEYADRTKKFTSDSDEVETVVLDEPLYIINGVEYSEVEMFGPSPTSPYAPLNQQDIESVKVLQGKEAIAAYGEKGRKGVLIIKTKNGKPATPKKAKSK